SLREAHGIDCGVAHVPPAVCTAHHLGMDVDAFGRKAEEFCHFVPQAKWPLCRYVKIRPIFADIGDGKARANRSVRNVGNVVGCNETPRSSCKGCVNAGVTAQHSINWCCRSCDGPFPFDTERVNRGDRLLISLGHDADKVLVTHDRYYAWKSLRQAVIHSHKPAALYRRMQHLAPQHVRQADVTRVSSATCHDAESFKTKRRIRGRRDAAIARFALWNNTSQRHGSSQLLKGNRTPIARCNPAIPKTQF